MMQECAGKTPFTLLAVVLSSPAGQNTNSSQEKPSWLTGIVMLTFCQSVALAALFVSAPVWAQTTQLTERELTPSTFLGLDLQGDFLANIPMCTADDYPDRPCRVATQEVNRFEVRGLPYLPISPGYKLFATVDNMNINQLVLTGNANNLYLVKELLTERFGKPTASNTKWVKLKSGATYKAEALNWSVRGVAIDFTRDLVDLNHYSVTFSPAALEADVDQNDLTSINKTPNL
jgi:hypothetical protein